jgi:IS30 family transposase
MGTYSQLTYNQRYHIYVFLKAGFCQTKIAEEIGVHKSTISRELKRNQGRRGYRPKQAQRFAAGRKNKAKIRIKQEDWNLIKVLIGLDWSPE